MLIEDFAKSYTDVLKSSVPVRTGTLRDSIFAKIPQLSDVFSIDIDAVNYAIYVNNRLQFVEKNDYKIDDFSTDITESIWDAFYNKNKEQENGNN